MKFEILSSKKYFSGKEEDYKSLLKLGFEFDTIGQDRCLNSSKRVYIEFSSVKEMKSFIEKHGPISLRKKIITICNNFSE